MGLERGDLFDGRDAMSSKDLNSSERFRFERLAACNTHPFSPIPSSWRRTDARSSHPLALRHLCLQAISLCLPPEHEHEQFQAVLEQNSGLAWDCRLDDASNQSEHMLVYAGCLKRKGAVGILILWCTQRYCSKDSLQ